MDWVWLTIGAACVIACFWTSRSSFWGTLLLGALGTILILGTLAS